MENVITTYTPEQLKAGNFQVVLGKAIIKSGAVLKANTLLGRHTDGTSNIAGELGYTDINSILIGDVDATTGDTIATVMLTGEFNKNALIVKEGSTIADFIETARKNSIFIKELY